MTLHLETTRAQIVSWFNTADLQCFYAGMRTDCAFALGIAPNNALFHAAFDLLDVYRGGADNQWLFANKQPLADILH